mmetsp:Transcript_10872/g.34357  ORF Transcript_10872/g.34357 Transcript_10872/m.34357 type:complete len:148 (-) Transcript_10872:147-590(-)|eukprot:CAMPEP_0185309228 /NCGR_PEP_ID=MMETSP1363-20130426/22330_1 /TAXON_ID=38817 /ORGANISM="Gephyrocapsa oceanica, Strain RCC1303" /LENGTH=147 /DNA_ID=CAMNT_0027906723 /DNA_START=54 /DNA_END=497 /DNA_ORIENTATION=-
MPQPSVAMPSMKYVREKQLANGLAVKSRAAPVAAATTTTFTRETDLGAASELGQSSTWVISCFNPAYYCNTGDGISRTWCGGREVCAIGGGAGTLTCCATVTCCWPVYTWAHFARGRAGVDYRDFFGGPSDSTAAPPAAPLNQEMSQ